MISEEEKKNEVKIMHIATVRLLLCDVTQNDLFALYELDAAPEVVRYGPWKKGNMIWLSISRSSTLCLVPLSTTVTLSGASAKYDIL